MLPEELLKRVRQIEFVTKKAVTEVMTGQYKSRFRGSGMQFSEHRVYQHGDDVRHIDWKASARTREPLIKQYEEERELTVLLLIDVSGSQTFGSRTRSKGDLAAEVAAFLSFAAAYSGDRVGMILFSDQIEKMIRPAKGRQHVLRMIGEVLAYKPVGKKTQLASALDAATRLMKHSGVVFVLSDFLDDHFDQALKRLSRKNDVIAIHTFDEREQDFPSVGCLKVQHPETGEAYYVDTQTRAFQNWFLERKEKLALTQQRLVQSQVDYVRIQSSEDYGSSLVRFFQKRSTKGHR